MNIMTIYHKLTDFDNPEDPSMYADLILNTPSLSIDEYKISLNLLRNVANMINLVPVVNIMCDKLIESPPDESIKVIVDMISLDNLYRDQFGDTFRNSKLDVLIKNILPKVITDDTLFKTQPKDIFDNSIDMVKTFNISVMLSYIDSSADIIPAIKYICKFAANHADDIESNFEQSDYSAFEDTPYLAYYYVASNVSQTKLHKQTITRELLKTYCILVGILLRHSLMTPKLYLPLTLVPHIHDIFDTLTDDYNCDYEYDYLKNMFNVYAEIEPGARDEIIEYLNSLNDHDDIMFKQLSRDMLPDSNQIMIDA